MHFLRLGFAFVALVACLNVSTPILAKDWQFDFGSGSPAPGFTEVSASTVYGDTTGYGFVDSTGMTDSSGKGADGRIAGFCTSTTPFVFGVQVPEGNYNVTVVFGNPDQPATTTIKAESRRLMMAPTDSAAGQVLTRSFTINVRTPLIAGGQSVKLSKTEMGPPLVPDWDNRLTLEFNGKNPAVSSVVISDAPEAVTVYIAGDSTVTDQPREPWSSWGQMLPNFFKEGVAISDQAESGLALYSFKGQLRLEKILSTMKPGDYLFIQFGHNDQKDKSPGAGPYTSYKENLRKFVGAVRAKGGIPVIVTPMERRRWNGTTFQPTLGDFAEAVRQIGWEQSVPVIDLNAMSTVFYNALGPDKSKQAFVQYPANTFPGQVKALADNTHHNGYGGYELARCIVEGIRTQVPALAIKLRDDAGSFDPSHPDDPATFAVPMSPFFDAQKPAGN